MVDMTMLIFTFWVESLRNGFKLAILSLCIKIIESISIGKYLINYIAIIHYVRDRLSVSVNFMFMGYFYI